MIPFFAPMYTIPHRSTSIALEPIVIDHNHLLSGIRVVMLKFEAILLLLWLVCCAAFQSHMPSVTRTMQRMQLFAQLGRVTIYKKEGCPYCIKAKELLEGKYELKINFVDIQEPDE